MTEERRELGAFPYLIAGLSYTPLIGMVFGGVAIIWGCATRKSGGRLLAAFGAGGILFTIVLCSAVFYFGFVERGGISDDLRSKLADRTLTSLVNAIEAHKLETGRYPESFEALQQFVERDSPLRLVDPRALRMGGKSLYFHYELIDTDHYYLLSVGTDGRPFTQDDMLPNVEVKPGSRVGLLTRRP